jgi:hypothetical protein
MELIPKLLAAADMCADGEQVNLDEITFLLRYAADELKREPEVSDEHKRLLDRQRTRVEALCDLLDRDEADRQTAHEGDLNALDALEESLEHELRTRFGGGEVLAVAESGPTVAEMLQYKAGAR